MDYIAILLRGQPFCAAERKRGYEVLWVIRSHLLWFCQGSPNGKQYSGLGTILLCDRDPCKQIIDGIVTGNGGKIGKFEPGDTSYFLEKGVSHA